MGKFEWEDVPPEVGPAIVYDATVSVAGVLWGAIDRAGHRVRCTLDAPKADAMHARMPALSVYLHHVEPRPDEGRDVFRLHYLVSPWASSPTEEQVLFSATLRALLLKPTIEGEELRGHSFDGQTEPLPLMLSSQLDHSDLSRFWSALGHAPRPAIQCWTAVAALRPEDDTTPEAPRVRERELRFGRKRSLQ